MIKEHSSNSNILNSKKSAQIKFTNKQQMSITLEYNDDQYEGLVPFYLQKDAISTPYLQEINEYYQHSTRLKRIKRWFQKIENCETLKHHALAKLRKRQNGDVLALSWTNVNGRNGKTYSGLPMQGKFNKKQDYCRETKQNMLEYYYEHIINMLYQESVECIVEGLKGISLKIWKS